MNETMQEQTPSETSKINRHPFCYISNRVGAGNASSEDLEGVAETSAVLLLPARPEVPAQLRAWLGLVVGLGFRGQQEAGGLTVQRDWLPL
jgi:hypothetical protein